MADAAIPNFAEPGDFLRFYGTSLCNKNDTQEKFRYVKLLEREAPLRYPYTFTSIAVDVVGSGVTFDELEPGKSHIIQAYLGVAPGVRIRLNHPQDVRVLKWDDNISAISEDLTGVLTHSLTPFEKPTFAVWIRPGKLYPILTPQNSTAELYPGGKTIKPRIIWIGAIYNYEEINEGTEIFDMLSKKKIPWRPMRFGRSLREIPS